MAQKSNSTITGCVLDESNEAVPFVSVVLSQNGSIITGGVTDDKGKFQIKTNAGSYDLSAEFIGYQKQIFKIDLKSGKQDIGTIILKESVQELAEVTVTAKQETKKNSVEHTSINTDASISGSKGSVLDILRTSTSVNVSSDNAITIRGKSNILVLMDGVPTTVTDLQSIPASNVKNVDIITNPDARFDAEGTGGIINIVSKKQTTRGLSGIIGGSYGFNDYANCNFALGYNTPKTSWRMNGNVKYEDDDIKGSLIRKFTESQNSINQQIRSDKRTLNSNIGLGATFRIDKKNIINSDIRFLLPRINNKQKFFNTYLTNDVHSVENRYSNVTWNRENIDFSTSWRHILRPDISEFSIGGNISKIWGHRPSHYYLEGQEIGKSKSGGSPFISSVQSDFKLKIPTGTIESGLKMSYRRNDISHKYYEHNGEDWLISQQQSNDLLHQEYIPAIYALFSSNTENRFTYKAGVRAEYSIVKLHSNKEALDDTNNDLFIAPTLSGEYKINGSQKISFAYSRRIGRPTYPQLNPYMSMVDAKTFEQGNMNLNSEKADNLDLSFSINKNIFTLFADLYFCHTADFITQVSKISNDDILLLTYINSDADVKTGLELTAKISPAKWLEATLSTNTFYTDTHGDFEDIDIDNYGWANSSNMLLSFMPDKSIDIQMQYFLSSPQYYPQFTTSWSHYMNVGLKKRFMKGALTCSLTMTDVFNTDKWKTHSNNTFYSLNNISRHKSRMLWVGLSYNFNSFKQQNNRKKEEVDRSRLNLGL